MSSEPESGCGKWSMPPPGVYWEWAGSFEQLQQVEQRLLVIIPFTLLIIILLIYVNTRSFVKTCIVLLAVPFSLVGAFWLLYLAAINSAWPWRWA